MPKNVSLLFHPHVVQNLYYFLAMYTLTLKFQEWQPYLNMALNPFILFCVCVCVCVCVCDYV